MSIRLVSTNRYFSQEYCKSWYSSLPPQPETAIGYLNQYITLSECSDGKGGIREDLTHSCTCCMLVESSRYATMKAQSQ